MRSGGGAGENMFCRRVLMRKKFSDLGAERFLRAGLVPGPGRGTWRAKVFDVVEKEEEDMMADLLVLADFAAAGNSLPKKLLRKSNGAIADVFGAWLRIFIRVGVARGQSIATRRDFLRRLAEPSSPGDIDRDVRFGRPACD